MSYQAVPAILFSFLWPALATAQLSNVRECVQDVLASAADAKPGEKNASANQIRALKNGCKGVMAQLRDRGRSLEDKRKNDVLREVKNLKGQAELTLRAVEDWEREIERGNAAEREVQTVKRQASELGKQFKVLLDEIEESRDWLEDEYEDWSDRHQRLMRGAKPLKQTEDDREQRVDRLWQELTKAYAQLRKTKDAQKRADDAADRAFQDWVRAMGDNQKQSTEEQAAAREWNDRYEQARRAQEAARDAVEEAASLDDDYDDALEEWQRAYQQVQRFFKASDLPKVVQNYHQFRNWLARFNQEFPQR